MQIQVLKNLLVILAIVILSGYTSYVYGNDIEVDSIFFHIYNQQFDKAENELTHSKQHIKPLSYNLLTTDLIWWKTIYSNKEIDFIILESDISKKLSNTENLSSGNKLEELIYLNYLFRLMAINNQFLRMLKYYIRINIFIESFDNSDLSIDEQNIFEIYKAIFNISKSKLLFIKPQYKYDNIEILKRYMESSSLINKTISCYFLAKIYSEIEKSPEQTLQYYIQLCNTYPNNKIFRNELTAIQLKIKNVD